MTTAVLHVMEPADDVDSELVPPEDPRAGLISIDPGRMGGTPCFCGTRVPIKHLWDYLEGGETLRDFLVDFDGISEEAVVAVLEAGLHGLLTGLRQPGGSTRQCS